MSNVDWLFQLPAPLRVAGYFGLQQLLGSKIYSIWQEFQSWERLSPQELDAAVEERLSKLLSSAVAYSAYYRELGLSVKRGESAKQFLKRFPILKRDQVRSRFASLVVDRLKGEITSPTSRSRKRYDWLVIKTGGTTGVPTSVIHDTHFRDWGRATRLFAQRLCGFPLGTRYFRLWGSEQDLFQQKENLDRRVLRNLLGEVPMNAFRAKEEELARHVATIHEHSSISHLMSYVDAAVILANYIQDRSLKAPHLESIMACAGTVTKEARQILSTTFNAGVYDKYGSRECADMACECSAHQGLHVFSPNVYLEVVNESGCECAPGEPGRILVTLLNNLSFPMIRYEIGDLAAWAPPIPCPCGLSFPKLESLQGRQDDMLTREDGMAISSSFVRHFVGVSLNRQCIREWQLEQTGGKTFVFRYIPFNSDGLDENLEALRNSFLAALGQSCSVKMQPVSEIPPSATGKVRWIIKTAPGTSKSPSPNSTSP